MLTNETKKQILERRLQSVEIQKFEQELTLKVSDAIGDAESLKANVRNNIEKQQKAIDVISSEIALLQ